MSKAYCCDLCGELYSPVIERRKFRFIERIPNTNASGIETEKGVDVCSACYEEFMNFVKSKRKITEQEETEIEEEVVKGGLL